MMQNITFNFTCHGTEKGIEIVFGEDQVFVSCKRGTDLADLDALLEYFIPNLDLQQISYAVARWWEQELYRRLVACKQRRTAQKAFANFCGRIAKKYAKASLPLEANRRLKNLIEQMADEAFKKMSFMSNSPESSRMEHGVFTWAGMSEPTSRERTISVSK